MLCLEADEKVGVRYRGVCGDRAPVVVAVSL